MPASTLLKTGRSFLGRHKRATILTLCLLVSLPLIAVLAAYMAIDPSKRFILSGQPGHRAEAGIVLGGGITDDGRPLEALQARLDSAATALQKGTVDKLILSGDNRFQNYDEPGAMMRYLVEHKNIPAVKLFPDYAGRSTYESCERAAKIFGLKKTVLFSAGSHLPRAIYLCRQFGIEAYGIASGLEANNAGRREPLARVKALYNIYVRGEPTILGKPIPLTAHAD